LSSSENWHSPVVHTRASLSWLVLPCSAYRGTIIFIGAPPKPPGGWHNALSLWEHGQ
jgi:hypothetical protein